MASVLVPPLPDTAFLWTPRPPEFVDLVGLEFGDVGTEKDGFDQVLETMLASFPAPGAITSEPDKLLDAADVGHADLVKPTEPAVTEALGRALKDGDAALGNYDGLFVTAPPTASGGTAGPPTPTGQPEAGGNKGAAGPGLDHFCKHFPKECETV